MRFNRSLNEMGFLKSCLSRPVKHVVVSIGPAFSKPSVHRARGFSIEPRDSDSPSTPGILHRPDNVYQGNASYIRRREALFRRNVVLSSSLPNHRIGSLLRKMGKKTAKKGKKEKTKRVSHRRCAGTLGDTDLWFDQSPFPILDLPTELIESICEVLRARSQLHSLASLNVANRTLRKITSRYLWESVRWTPRSWRSDVYCQGRIPESFAHIKYVHSGRRMEWGT